LPDKEDGSCPLERFTGAAVSPSIKSNHSPRHASSISLILNINTGLVSPQFHVSHDDFFKTVRPSTGNPLWQQLSGFHKSRLQMPSSKGVYTCQVDFIQAYPQADIEYDLYMELPKGIQTKHGDGKTHILKLLKNLYGQKQAGRVWSQHLFQGLKDIGFEPSNVDECGKGSPLPKHQLLPHQD
jgi:Reverse transcriptase (RNA-dependent DNA polymerase)